MLLRRLLILLIILLSTPCLFALELSGRLSSEVYLFEENDSSHVRIYERLRSNLTLWQTPDYKSIDLHTYFRYSTDLKNKTDNDPQTYIYDSYLRFKNIPLGLEIRLGRQYVYNLIGSGSIDGLRLKISPVNNGTIDLYGGSAVNYQDPETIESLADYGSYGGRISYRYMRYRIGANWQLQYAEGEIARNMLGTDLTWQKSNFDIFGKSVLNIEKNDLSEILARASYNYNKYYLSAEFQWRDPYLRDNSIFSLIDFRKYKEFRFEFHRTIASQIRIVSGLDINLYESDNAFGGRFGLNGGFWSLMWRHRAGYGGKSNGLIGFVSVNLARSMKLYFNGRFSRYKVQELQDGLNDAYMSIVGLEKNFGRILSVKTEMQYLRNGVSESDLRFNLKLTNSFTTAGSKYGGR